MLIYQSKAPACCVHRADKGPLKRSAVRRNRVGLGALSLDLELQSNKAVAACTASSTLHISCYSLDGVARVARLLAACRRVAVTYL